MAKHEVRRVGGPGGILVCLVLAGLVWFVGGLESRVAESGYREIKTNQARLDSGRTWVDGRWEGELTARLAQLGPEEASDPEARARIVNEIGALSFIEATGSPEILWPDGLRVPVLFQNPVACIAVGKIFYAVAPDGTVLSGTWKSPPKIGPGWLPVIGPVASHFPGAEPGLVLDGEVELDAISIAISMWQYLSDKDLASMGRVLIDSTRGREAGPLEPGARLLMEGGREVVFGRPPRAGNPGSLPPEEKWNHLSRALELLETGQSDGNWDLLDLRWDRPELRLVGDDESEDPLADQKDQ